MSLYPLTKRSSVTNYCTEYLIDHYQNAFHLTIIRSTGNIIRTIDRRMVTLLQLTVHHTFLSTNESTSHAIAQKLSQECSSLHHLPVLCKLVNEAFLTAHQRHRTSSKSVLTVPTPKEFAAYSFRVSNSTFFSIFDYPSVITTQTHNMDSRRRTDSKNTRVAYLRFTATSEQV